MLARRVEEMRRICCVAGDATLVERDSPLRGSNREAAILRWISSRNRPVIVEDLVEVVPHARA